MATRVAKISSHTAPAGTTPRPHPDGVPCYVGYQFFPSALNTVVSLNDLLAPQVTFENFYASADAGSVFGIDTIEDGILIKQSGPYLVSFALKVNLINSGTLAGPLSAAEVVIGGNVQATIDWSQFLSSSGGSYFIDNYNLRVTFCRVIQLTSGIMDCSVNLNLNQGTCFPSYLGVQLARMVG